VLVFENHRCIACNDNATLQLQCDRRDLMGAWPEAFESATNEDGSSAASRLRELYDTSIQGTPTSTEVRLKRAATTFWAEIAWSAFRMKHSWHVLVVVRDVTSRKVLESQLRRHRDFLDNIINAVPDQLYVKATDHRIVLANDAFCLAHGRDRTEVVGMNSHQFLPAEMHGPVGEVEDHLLLTGNCRSVEQTVALPNGQYQVISVKRSTFADQSTGERFIVATSRDMTEDRLRENRLHLLASVFNGASEGVAIISTAGIVVEANPAFLSMTGLEHKSPLGKSFFDALRLDARCGEDILRQVSRGNPWSGKAALAWSSDSGRSYWVSLSASTEVMGQDDRVIALVSDITELERTQEKLRHQALYDNLTGLPNRRHFRDHLEYTLKDAAARNRIVMIGFLDLDDFKHVNDSAGHGAGDLLLQSVGRRIQREAGKDAFVARFGGDEFAIILTGTEDHKQEQSAMLERLLVSFREPFRFAHLEAIVGLSVGVTSYPEDGVDADSLMCNADIAMYAAKSAGKNRVRQFDPAMQNSVNLRQQLHVKLRRALADGEIQLAFQPKVLAGSRQPDGCEALVRWQTADGRFIPPSEFIPIAEQTGLIIPLGEMVFQLAAEQAHAWNAAGITPSIAVNVSPHQLRHPRFLEQLVTTLTTTKANATWFELEITEYAMMDDIDYAITVIDELERLGFHVAVDDFGTGYSSLSYLKNFNIHTLKIDLSFVRDVAYDSQSRAIVQSIVSLGSGLGLTVVAEGVETVEQAESLADLGCDVLQGYLIGRPMPAAEYLKWLEQYDPRNAPVT
jgi:diguanylate cyclase (GGDEF)-like protein/PAS domain S-box-containing protein